MSSSSSDDNALNLLWDAQRAIYDGFDDIESLYDEWVKDGDEKHVERVIERTTETICALLRARAVYLEAQLRLLPGGSEVMRILDACRNVLESCRKNVIEQMQWIEVNPQQAEEVAPSDLPMESLRKAWYEVYDDECEHLDMSLMILENDSLRMQLESLGQSPLERPFEYPAEPELTDTESNIVEALGRNTLTGVVLLKKAEYDPASSHYRQILSHLVKRRILYRSHQGYYNPRAPK